MRETKTDHKILGRLRLGDEIIHFITSSSDPTIIGVEAPLGSMLWYDSLMYTKTGVADTSWECYCERFTQMQFTGFLEWTGTGDYWSRTGNQFTVLRGGVGRILTNKVAWSGNQTITLTAGECNWVYISDTGVLGVATSVGALYNTAIRLLEVLYDGTNAIVVKENHPYQFPSKVSEYIHHVIGTVFRGTAGALARVATGTGGAAGDRQLKFVGADVLEDHGLSTTLAELSPITWTRVYKNASGKWIIYDNVTEHTAVYNNAGAPTLSGNNTSILWTLYVSKDELNTTTPKYIAVMNNSTYNKLANVQAAVSAGSFVTSDNELAAIEVAQVGFISVRRVGGVDYVEWVLTSKDTAGLRVAQIGASGNHLLLGDIEGGQYGDGGHYHLSNWVVGTSAPTVNEDVTLYKPMTWWYNSTSGLVYLCLDNTEGAAVWQQMGGVYVEEAPIDGKQYARKDGAWSEVVTGGGGLPDDTNSFLLNIGNLRYTVTVDTADKTECKFITPSAIPPQTTKAIGFSSDSVYMAIGSATAPYIHVYKRTGASHVKLADVTGGNPTGTVTGVAFTANGLYMAVSHTSSPYVTIYKNNGSDVYAKLTNPVTLPTGAAMGVSFNSDGTLLVVAHTVSPFMTVYSMSGDVFTKLTNPTSLPVDTATGCAVMGDGSYIMLSHNVTPYVNIYLHSGGVLTKQSNPGSLPTVASNGVACSVDGVYWFISQASTPYVSWYKRSSSTFTKQTNPPAIAEGYNLNVSLWEKPY